MTSNRRIRGGKGLGAPRGGALLCLVLASASCVPAEVKRTAVAEVALAVPAAVPVLPRPLDLKPVPAEQAVALNAAIPVSDGFNPAARPFSIRGAVVADRLRSLECLTAAVYYEAASESEDGQRAVAQVVLNRVRHPAFPANVCGVVYQNSERPNACQFTFACDGSMARRPSIAGWARARRIAAEALAGRVFAPVGLSTHYHTHQVLPHWAPSLLKSAVVGAHNFYRWTGAAGTPPAFRQAYSGFEPLPGPKPQLAAAVPLVTPEALKAEIAALLKPVKAPPAPAAKIAAETELTASSRSEPDLPESTIRDEYRNTGKPLDRFATSGTPTH